MIRTTRPQPEIDATPGVRLVLCGEPMFLRGDNSHLALDTIDALLLAYVVIEGPTLRADLAKLLWPRAASDRARGNLRQRLFRLKRTLGFSSLVEDDVISLAPGVQVDVLESEAATSQQLAPLLGSMVWGSGSQAKTWLDTARQRHQDKVRTSLEHRCTELEAQGDLDAALQLAGKLTELRPISEQAYRRVMRLHELRGDRAAALSTYERCVDRFVEELGSPPSAEIRGMARAIHRRNEDGNAVEREERRREPEWSAIGLVGRSAEWADLDRAKLSHRAVLLQGEAGMGKSRMLLTYAESQESMLVLGARPGDSRVPFALLTRLADQLLPRIQAPVADGVRRELARLLPGLGEPPAPSTDVQAAKARFHAAMIGLAEQARTQTSAITGVALDDIHFADDASLEVVQRLVGNTPGLMWVLACTPAELPPPIAALCDELLQGKLAERVVLQPLNERDTVQLVGLLGLPALASGIWPTRLLSHTGGNPLLLIETIRAIDVSEAGLAQAARVPLPSAQSAVDLFKRRLTRLGSGAIHLAQCAAIAGEDFNLDLASRALDLRASELVERWADLENAGVMKGNAFVHDPIRQAAMLTLPSPAARRIHEKCAEHLEATGGSAARIAQHWLEAGLPGSAGPAFMRAAKLALDRLCLPEHLGLLNQAANAFFSAGDHAQGCSALMEAWRISQSAGSPSQQEALVAQLYKETKTFEQKLEIAWQHSMNLCTLRQTDRAVAVSEAALNQLTLQEGHHLLESLLRCSLVVPYTLLGRTQDAEQQFHLAEPALRDQSDPHHLAPLLHARCINLLLTERTQECHRIAQEMHKVCQPLAFHERFNALSLWAQGLQTQGDVRQALQRYLQAFEQINGLGPNLTQDLWWAAVAQCQLTLGLYSAALASLQRYRERCPAHLLQAWRAALVEAGIWLDLGQPSRAIGALDDAHDIDLSPPADRCQMLLLSARAVEAMGKPANRLLLQAQKTLQDSPHPKAAGMAQAHRQLELALAATGKPGERYARSLRVLESCSEQDHTGMHLTAQVHCAQAALQVDERLVAWRHAQKADYLLNRASPDHLYVAEVGLTIWRSGQGMQPGDAESALMATLQWVSDRAEQHVPDALRESFLEANPVNRTLQLAAASARLPAAKGSVP